MYIFKLHTYGIHKLCQFIVNSYITHGKIANEFSVRYCSNNPWLFEWNLLALLDQMGCLSWTVITTITKVPEVIFFSWIIIIYDIATVINIINAQVVITVCYFRLSTGNDFYYVAEFCCDGNVQHIFVRRAEHLSWHATLQQNMRCRFKLTNLSPDFLYKVGVIYVISQLYIFILFFCIQFTHVFL